MKEQIASRMEEFIKDKGWAKAHFAKIIGIAPQDVNKLLKAKLNPLNYIDKLVSEGADKNWLLTGEYSEAKKIVRELTSKQAREEAKKNLVPYLQKLKMRVFPIVSKIAAGTMKEYYEQLDPENTIVVPYKHDNCVALQVDGDSMADKIDNGDLVLVDLYKNVKDGDIVAVRLKSGEQLVKRFKRINGTVILYSDNNKYTPISVKETEVEVLKKVVKIIKNV